MFLELECAKCGVTKLSDKFVRDNGRPVETVICYVSEEKRPSTENAMIRVEFDTGRPNELRARELSLRAVKESKYPPFS